MAPKFSRLNNISLLAFCALLMAQGYPVAAQDEPGDTPDKYFERTSDMAPDGSSTEEAPPPAAGTETPLVTGGRKELPEFDQVMQNLLMSYAVPGGALAIVKDGRLVFARGYGLAVKQGQVPFSPASIFCLASVTKAVQGASVLRLVDEGKLKLDDTIYDVLGRPKLGNVVDKRVYEITVRQLLHHSAGWKTDDVGYDNATYANLTADGPVPFEKLFLWVMANKQLDYAPGAECHYSNYQFGGVKLVIEHASGMDFEKYINEHVMAPMGIADTHLEPSKGIYLPNEAHRYGPKGHQLPGGHTHEQLTGSLGSWEASVIDMVKFLSALDGSRGNRFLSDKSFAAMVAPVPPPVPVRENGSTFGLGWDSVQKMDGGIHFCKGGGVAGVHTFIEHLPNNIDIAYFFNGSGINQKPKIMGAASNAIHRTIKQVHKWPDIDLFAEYK